MTELGFAARFPDICPRCDGLIHIGDRIVRQGERLIHVECASGSDDR